LGVLWVLFPVGLIWVLGALAMGALIHQAAPLYGLGVLTLPLLSLAVYEPALIARTCGFIVLLMIVKRHEANKGLLALKAEQRHLWLNRLLHDRDRA
jgi:hypothetical protein